MADDDTPHPLQTQRELQHIPVVYIIFLFAVLVFVVFFVIANR
ncbi:MAG: hypothetical protein JWQ89_1572 [Devosia sp.]|nr:hypothetical protein [Devosia sp.]MDB5539845.1 hypothetical protein [Devosia sp.]